MKKVNSLFLILFFSTFFISCTEEEIADFSNMETIEMSNGGENEKSDPPEEPPSEEGDGN